MRARWIDASVARAAALLACLGAGGCGLLPPQHVVLPAAPIDARRCAPLPTLDKKTIVGAEDIAVHQETGFAYVSSTDRRAAFNGRTPVAKDGLVGHLYRLDLRAEPPRYWDVTPPDLPGRTHFGPHGISLRPRPDGSARLFVINHDPAGDTILLFDIAGGDGDATPLRLAATIPVDGEIAPAPNDLAAVGERQFFVTNEHGRGSQPTVLIKDLFGMNGGSLAYFDGARFHPAVAHLPFANGVAVVGDKLYVAATRGGRIVTLRWHPDGTVDEIGALPLGTGVDNIDVVPSGQALLVAAHPSLLRFVLYADGRFGVDTSPSQIVRVRLAADGTPGAPAELLKTDGSETKDGGISAASVAAAYRTGRGEETKLIVGAVFSDRILVCTLPRLP